MHILETYALLTGCKIDKCFIAEEPIQLPEKKYITFQGYSPKGNNKQYDKWNEVLELLKSNPNFDREIIQIGEADDFKYPVNVSYLGKTTYNSLAYLIKHSDLHLGFDSLPIHLASYYNIKIVGLYSYYPSTCGPYFSDPQKIRLFHPDFSKIKPTFFNDDPFRIMNSIDHNEIYKAVLELLGRSSN